MNRILLATAALVLGTGAVALAGGIAAGQTVGGGSACTQIQSTLASIQSTLPQAATNPSALKSKIGGFASKLGAESVSAPAPVKSAVSAFVKQLKAVSSGHVNVSKLTSDAKAIGAACAAATAPVGAPGTGGGSTAGVEDTALIVVGAAAILAGAGILGLVRRSRVRNRA